ncbi:MAG TPA: GGDEF domain-containing protein [Myxococcota bacterium]|nr:GGDEF domain-containing protein [Myxococcota bacterium]
MKSKTVVTVISPITEKRPTGQQACLVVIYGPDLGKKYNLDQPEMTVGRSSRCEIQVDQESISRNHCRFVVGAEGVLIRDLGSTNGTYVNDEQVFEKVLLDGDLVKIGRTIFKFLSGGNIENSYHEEIYRLTTIDGLTQVYNKRHFTETLERELSRARRYKRDLSLILFDVDHFKKVNDTYGHLAGDYVLKALAQAVKAKIRREDLMARYGGEEFAILLPEIDAANTRVLAEKVRSLVERFPFSFENARIPVTISLGLASADEKPAESPEELVKVADERLYRAKRGGRNLVVWS